MKSLIMMVVSFLMMVGGYYILPIEHSLWRDFIKLVKSNQFRMMAGMWISIIGFVLFILVGLHECLPAAPPR